MIDDSDRLQIIAINPFVSLQQSLVAPSIVVGVPGTVHHQSPVLVNSRRCTSSSAYGGLVAEDENETLKSSTHHRDDHRSLNNLLS